MRNADKGRKDDNTFETEDKQEKQQPRGKKQRETQHTGQFGGRKSMKEKHFEQRKIRKNTWKSKGKGRGKFQPQEKKGTIREKKNLNSEEEKVQKRNTKDETK